MQNGPHPFPLKPYRAPCRRKDGAIICSESTLCHRITKTSFYNDSSVILHRVPLRGYSSALSRHLSVYLCLWTFTSSSLSLKQRSPTFLARLTHIHPSAIHSKVTTSMRLSRQIYGLFPTYLHYFENISNSVIISFHPSRVLVL